jgi:hypothetical protein
MATVAQETPLLIPGDNLSRDDFLRIWEMRSDVKHAELIGGVVFMPSPTSTEHGDCESDVGTWVGYYRTYTPGCASGHNTSCFLLEDLPQPDLNLRILPEYGGRSYGRDNLLAGLPEFFSEVCRSSVVYDLHQKKDLYEQAGVPEYLAILIAEKEIRWHLLEDDAYRLMRPGRDGVFRSRAFPGLWLNGAALLRGDMPKVLETLQAGIASEEHAAFVRKLKQRKRRLTK